HLDAYGPDRTFSPILFPKLTINLANLIGEDTTISARGEALAVAIGRAFFLILGFISFPVGFAVPRIPFGHVVQVDIESGKTLGTFNLIGLSQVALMVLGAGLMTSGAVFIWRTRAGNH